MSCLGKGRDYWNRMGTQLTCFNLFIFVSLQTIKTSNPSILKKKKSESAVKWSARSFCWENTVPSPHIVATYTHLRKHTVHPIMWTQKFISSFLAPTSPSASSRMNSCMTWCWVSFPFFLVWCTYEHLSSVSIWTQLLGLCFSFLSFLSSFCFPLGPGRVGCGLLLLSLFCCCGCFQFSFAFLLLLSSLLSFLWRPPHHPSSIIQARIEPLLPFFASSCAAWTFGGWKSQSSPPHQVLCFICLFCAIWLLKDHPSPHLSTFSIQHREMNGNKIFSCHHPFLALCRQPHSVSRKLCVRMTPPCRPFRALPRPHPLHPVSPHPPSFSLSAYTCLFECRWHKKTFIATKYICFSILSVAPSRRHLWHALLYWTVPQLCRLTSNPLLQPSPASAWIWLASIFTLCFFFPPIRPSTRLLHVSVCVLRGGGGLPPAAAAPPSEASRVRARACCLCQCSVCVCQTSLCCPLCVRARLVLVLSPCWNQNCWNLTLPPAPPLLIPRGFHERANRANPVRWLTVLCVHLQNCRFKLKKAPRAEMRECCEMLSFGGRQISRFMISFHGD